MASPHAHTAVLTDGCARRVYTFLPDAVVLLPTRVERPAKGGGWELLEDAYSKRVDFNQSGFTLHLLTEPEEPGAATHGGSQQPLGSQGPPAAVVEPSRPVDVEYTNIRCIKRGALRPGHAARLRALTRSACMLADTSTHGYVIWTVGLHEPVDDEEEDDDQALTKDALAARAEAQKAMTKSDAAITLKFVRGDDASLEKDVMPLIFEANPVRHRGMPCASAAPLLTCIPGAQEVVAAKPKPPAVKMSHATLVQGKSAAMDSQHGGGGGASMVRLPACCVPRCTRADCSAFPPEPAGRRHRHWRAAGGAQRELRRPAGAPAARRAAAQRQPAARHVRCVSARVTDFGSGRLISFSAAQAATRARRTRRRWLRWARRLAARAARSSSARRCRSRLVLRRRPA